MPDLTIEVMSMCSSLEHGEYGNVGGYTQYIHHGHNDYTCTCKAFKYRKNRDMMCKHLREFDSSLCHYHELVDGPPDVEGVCPKCGKPTVYVRVGV